MLRFVAIAATTVVLSGPGDAQQADWAKQRSTQQQRRLKLFAQTYLEGHQASLDTLNRQNQPAGQNEKASQPKPDQDKAAGEAPAAEGNDKFLGRVVDSQGKPVATADVSVFTGDYGLKKSPPTLDLKTTTNAEGIFEFSQPANAMNYVVWVTHPEKGIGVRSVMCRIPPPDAEGLPDRTVAPPDQFVVRLNSEPGKVRVLGPDLQPVSDARVRVQLIRAYKCAYDKQKLTAHLRESGDAASLWLSGIWTADRIVVPPRELQASFEGETNADGVVLLPGVASSEIHSLIIDTPKLGRQEVPRNNKYEGRPGGYVVRLNPTGKLSGVVNVSQRASAAGFSLQELKLSFRSSLRAGPRNSAMSKNGEYPYVESTTSVSVDANGRFSVPVIPTLPKGTIELIDPFPRESPFYADLPKTIKLEAGQTGSLQIRIDQSVLATGFVRKRGSNEPIADCNVTLTDLVPAGWRDKRSRQVTTDAAGRFEVRAPPGPLEIKVTHAVPGFTPVFAFEQPPRHMMLGLKFTVPESVDSVTLPPVEYVATKTITGRLLDEQGKPAGKLWHIHGYPAGKRARCASSETNDEGVFTLIFPIPYPPTSFAVNQNRMRVLPKKADTRFRELKVVSSNPLVLQMTEKIKTLNAIQPDWNGIRRKRIAEHDRNAATKLVGEWTMTLPAGFVYPATISQPSDGRLKLSCKGVLAGVFAFSKNQMELVQPQSAHVRDYVWTLREDGILRLIEEDHGSGSMYVGAQLSRKVGNRHSSVPAHSTPSLRAAVRR